MYRQVQQARDNMVNVERAVRAGILAENTREMSGYGTEGMAMVDQMLHTLREGLTAHDPGEPEVNRNLVEATIRALTLAWSASEKMATGTSVTEMRSALLDVKSYVDFAAAYIATALGTEFEL